jgi:formylglycine-generating enzyme required for sulfatase activity
LVNCVSRFGSFDHIGNLWEWTDDIRTSTANPEADINNMAWKRFLGTTSVTAFPAGSANGSIPALINSLTSGYIGSWNVLTGFPSATGGGGSKSFLWAAGNGDKRAVIRGGAWNHGVNAGRFAMLLLLSPRDVVTDTGGRCALSGP